MLTPDYSKRNYLLPKGCKDLIDVIRLLGPEKVHRPQLPGYLSPITGELLVSATTSVGELADLLGQKPFKIIADLMELGIFANANQHLDFPTVCKIARKYGFTAKRPA